MKPEHNRTRYRIEEGTECVDFKRVHGWLTESYWSPGVTREQVEKAARYSSLVVGCYLDEETVGFLRVVSDRVRFAWIADVFVADEHRGKGLATAMVRFALDHPEHRDVAVWTLATRDAHEVYARCGFQPMDQPERGMIYRPGSKKTSSGSNR